MDESTFDALTRRIGAGTSRRRLLKLFGSGLIGITGVFGAHSARAMTALGQFGDVCTANGECDTQALLTCDDGRSGQPNATCRGDVGFVCFDSGDCSNAASLLCLNADGVECTATNGIECGTCGVAAPTCFGTDHACDDNTNCCPGLVCSAVGDSGGAICHAACSAVDQACAVDGDCCSGLGCTNANVCAAITPSGHATVTIHKATCPTGVGAEIFTQCHDNVLGGVSFAIDGFEIGSGVITTDSSGVASQTILEAAASGDVTITEDAGTFANYLGAYVYCAEQHAGTVLYDGSADTGAVTFTVHQGDDIICDWYNLTSAVSEPPVTGGTTTLPTSEGTTTLPATGVATGAETGISSTWLGAAALGGAAAFLAGKKLRDGGTTGE